MKKIYVLGASLLLLAACNERVNKPVAVNTSFAELSSIKIGGETAAEITAFDPLTKRLFVVNNDGVSRVDVIDFTEPGNLVQLSSIFIDTYGGGVNSVAVKNGLLAMAVEGFEKTDLGKVLVYQTEDIDASPAQVQVGALPDMVTFSPDGRFIVTANEGEHNDDYSIDPMGSISIIDVFNSYAVQTLDFTGFESQYPVLKESGFRILDPMPLLPWILSQNMSRSMPVLLLLG